MNFRELLKSCLSLLLLNVFWSGASNANSILYGKDIKDQASEYFNEIGIEAEILTSDKRAFFSCSEKLQFMPRIVNDWRTVAAKCESQNWQTILRTTALQTNKDFDSIQETSATIPVVSIVRNMSRGQVISKEDLRLVSLPEQRIFEGFRNISDLIGRKVTSNIAKGTVLKARHVKFRLTVNKNDTVLVVLGNNKLSITTYGIALAAGQKGDMITVENIKSKKIFKAIVLDEKKVTPLTNM
jgi:flagella basal body P-ring formation protein FlgA